MAAPTIVTGHTTGVQATNVTSHVINAPTHVSGDVIYLASVIDSPGVSMTPPTGFAVVDAAYDNIALPGATSAIASAWKKTAGGSEPASYTWTSNTAERSVSIAWAVNGDAGIHAVGTNASGTSASATVPAVTTTVVDTLRISIVFTDAITTAHGTAAGHTKLAEISQSSAASASVHYKTLAASGTDASQTVSITSDDWVGVTFAIASSSGTAYTQAVAGTLTSAGDIARKTGKPVAGTLTSAGELVRKVFKLVAGTLTSAGAVNLKTLKNLGGTLTSAGDVVALKIRLYLQAVGGTLTSSGELVRKTNKTLAGTLTSAGELARKTFKAAGGTLTSSGTVATRLFRLYLQAVGGTLTSSGTVARKTLKAVGGTLTAAGELARKTKKLVAGTFASSGALVALKSGLTFAAVALTLASRNVLTLPERVRSWTVAIRNALTVREKD